MLIKSFSKFIDDQRGIAMTESVIVIPFFLLIWMALIGFHHLYQGRLEAQVKAHAGAYPKAISGDCSGSQEDANKRELDESVSDPDARKMLDVSTGGESFSWFHIDVTASVNAGNIPGPMGGPEKSTKGRARLMCNSKPADGLGDLFARLVNDAIGGDDE